MDKTRPSVTLPETRAGAIRRLVEPQPSAPDDAAVQVIHRGERAYIPLGRKVDGKWQDLGAVATGQPFLPGLLAHLAHDGYFGLNSSYRTGVKAVQRTRWKPIPEFQTPSTIPSLKGRHVALGDGPTPQHQVRVWERSRTNEITGLPRQEHTTETLRWLNVAYADLDCYKHGLSVGEVLGELVAMQDAGEIPPASLFVRSGRGVWALWLLVDGMNPKSGEREVHKLRHSPDTPARATVRALALYAKVQRAIVTRLASLGADLGAVDGPRYAPFPGTLKTGSDQRVQYWVQALADGVPAYTLVRLAEAFDCDIQRGEHPVIAAALPERFADEVAPEVASSGRGLIARESGRNPSWQRGWTKRWLYLVQDLEILLRLRGGTLEAPGIVSRNQALLYYALALKGSGMSDGDVKRRCEPLGHKMRLTPREIAGAIRNGTRKRKALPSRHLARASVRKALAVTDTERSYLTPDTAHNVATGRWKANQRHEAIKRVIAENAGRVPSLRQMKGKLALEGCDVSHVTLRADYRACGIVSADRGGRPHKLPL